MRIDLKNTQTRVVIILVAIIIIPILINQFKSIVAGAYTSYMLSQPKTVVVNKPVAKEIYPEYKTTGRIEAKTSVDIVARVSGWLQKRYFDEGNVVKKGQKLFLIEPDEYILATRNANATVNENSAVYKNSQIDLHRAEQLYKEDLVSREYYDNAVTERNKNRAALDGSLAQLSKAKLDLSYTNITSPMDGRIGKVMITEGNYVTPNSGVIAQIYSTNPIKVNFPLKSSDFITLKKVMISKSDGRPSLSVFLDLADGSTYDIEGKIEFVNNKIEEGTGTVSMTAIFDNPNEILVPGDYANIRIRLNSPTKVMLIPQSATKTDVGTGYYVWVVKNGQVEKRNVIVNESIDNQWVVESGLSYDDEIVTEGIQDLNKTGQKIKIKQDKK